MPRYDYECPLCKTVIEIEIKAQEVDKATIYCQACMGVKTQELPMPMVRKISSAPFFFKGGSPTAS